MKKNKVLLMSVAVMEVDESELLKTKPWRADIVLANGKRRRIFIPEFRSVQSLSKSAKAAYRYLDNLIAGAKK